MRGPITRGPVATAAATLLVGLLAPITAATAATAAAAGWTSATAVQPGTNPILSFSPTGAAVIGSQLSAHGRVSGANIDLAPDGSSFAARPSHLTAPSARHGAEALSGLALSSTGYLAASFANPTAPAPVLARVAPPASRQFTTVQQLVPLGSAPGGQASPDSLSFVATTDGELVGAGADDGGDLHTVTLAQKQTHFSTAGGPSGFSATDAYALASDAKGNTFLAGDGPDGCSTVAFRPAHGHFTRTYATGNCSSATPNIFDAITATGNGAAALLSEDVSEAGTAANRLFIQTGREGHFAQATELGGAVNGPVGLASDADGELTAEWTACVAGPVLNGQLTVTNCSINATTGSVSTGFSARATAGTPLAGGEAGTTLSALTADRAVAVSRCHTASACSFSVFTAAPGGGFRTAHLLGAGAKLISLTGDAHGDLLVVWADAHDHLYAATGSAATGRWSADRRLSSTPVNPATVQAVYGPQRAAVVAWSTATTTYATRFTL